MGTIEQAERQILVMHERATAMAALAISALVAALALAHSRPWFLCISAMASVGTLWYWLRAADASSRRDELCDRLVIHDGIRSGVARHRAWLEQERTQRRTATSVRRLCRSAHLKAYPQPTFHHARTVRALEPQLLRLAARLDANAGRIPASVIARTRVLISSEGPLVLHRPDQLAVRQAQQDAIRALARIESDMDGPETSVSRSGCRPADGALATERGVPGPDRRESPP